MATIESPTIVTSFSEGTIRIIPTEAATSLQASFDELVKTLCIEIDEFFKSISDTEKADLLPIANNIRADLAAATMAALSGRTEEADILLRGVRVQMENIAAGVGIVLYKKVIDRYISLVQKLAETAITRLVAFL